MTALLHALRNAGESDVPALTAIYAHSVLHGTGSYELDPPDEAEMARRFRAIKADGFPFIVAERDGAVLGYAYASPFRTRPAYRFLVEDSVYVASHAQRGGVGRALLARLLELSEAQGFRQMVAVIGDGEGNKGSVAVHAACGFRHVGRMEATGFKHGRWLDTVIMQRPLGKGAGELP